MFKNFKIYIEINKNADTFLKLYCRPIKNYGKIYDIMDVILRNISIPLLIFNIYCIKMYKTEILIYALSRIRIINLLLSLMLSSVICTIGHELGHYIAAASSRSAEPVEIGIALEKGRLPHGYTLFRETDIISSRERMQIYLAGIEVALVQIAVCNVIIMTFNIPSIICYLIIFKNWRSIYINTIVNGRKDGERAISSISMSDRLDIKRFSELYLKEAPFREYFGEKK